MWYSICVLLFCEWNVVLFYAEIGKPFFSKTTLLVLTYVQRQKCQIVFWFIQFAIILCFMLLIVKNLSSYFYNSHNLLPLLPPCKIRKHLYSPLSGVRFNEIFLMIHFKTLYFMEWKIFCILFDRCFFCTNDDYRKCLTPYLQLMLHLYILL